jgi:serine/threonine protein kinase
MADCETLGKGASGMVIKAHKRADKEFKRPFAIKIILKKSLRQKEDLIEDLRNEIQILWTLDHPNIVKYHETYSDREKMYLVMEYCPYSILDC